MPSSFSIIKLILLLLFFAMYPLGSISLIYGIKTYKTKTINEEMIIGIVISILIFIFSLVALLDVFLIIFRH